MIQIIIVITIWGHSSGCKDQTTVILSSFQKTKSYRLLSTTTPARNQLKELTSRLIAIKLGKKSRNLRCGLRELYSFVCLFVIYSPFNHKNIQSKKYIYINKGKPLVAYNILCAENHSVDIIFLCMYTYSLGNKVSSPSKDKYKNWYRYRMHFA